MRETEIRKVFIDIKVAVFVKHAVNTGFWTIKTEILSKNLS